MSGRTSSKTGQHGGRLRKPARACLAAATLAALLTGCATDFMAGGGAMLLSAAGGNGAGCALPPAAVPVNDPGMATLDPDQTANAKIIIGVGKGMQIPDYGLVIAIATAMQESKLRNIDYGDRDSIGLFQQRPSQGWGRVDQIMDPQYASRKFYAALLKVPNWQSMALTDAAQVVQRSGAPNAYAQWEGLARKVVSESTGVAAIAGPETGGGCFGNFPATQGSADGQLGERIVYYASKWQGTVYVWGGGDENGPTKTCGHGFCGTGFDCSGLTKYAVYQATGGKVNLPHNAAAQYGSSTMLRHVSYEELQPGDLVFFSGLAHVGIYIGGGKMINAPRTGDVVKIAVISSGYYKSRYYGAARAIA